MGMLKCPLHVHGQGFRDGSLHINVQHKSIEDFVEYMLTCVNSGYLHRYAVDWGFVCEAHS